MLLAASESAVTKKPRLRMTIRRSSSVRPFGSFQVAMSRDMLISCGIQWFEQVARYFSHAHLYLNGTSWLTSVWPLMMRLSAAFTRRLLDASTRVACGALTGATGMAAATVPSSSKEDGCTARAEGGRLCARLAVFDVEGLTSSSQTNIGGFPVRSNYPSVASKHQALLDIGRASLLC